MPSEIKVNVLIIGAGAAGLMCAISAGQRGRKVLVLDHSNKVGKKILMSGGGRCNFTNYHIEPNNYLSQNPHFCKSALSRYTQWHFIEMVEKHQIPYHEKTLGQLFCDKKSKDILNMLLDECAEVGAQVKEKVSVKSILQTKSGFQVESDIGSVFCQSLVIATGGLSIPKMGATGFGYKIANQFGINVLPQSAGLVPYTLSPKMKQDLDGLSGTSVDSVVSCNGKSFRENILFTHRGLSGPAILQISSYWRPGDDIEIDLLPDTPVFDDLKDMQSQQPKSKIKTYLIQHFSKKLSERMMQLWFAEIEAMSLAEISDHQFHAIEAQLKHWRFKPPATEGYRTAEVTLGGVDTNELSSKTFEAKKVPGLYFIGEVVDVTGHLGGYNFQWAWSSGHAAGQFV